MAIEEEFSIEIPDKDADSIHSGAYLMCPDGSIRGKPILTVSQWTRQSSTFSANPMLTNRTSQSLYYYLSSWVDGKSGDVLFYRKRGIHIFCFFFLPS